MVTTGSDAAKYRKDGEYSHTMEELLSPFEVVAYKVGMNYAEPFWCRAPPPSAMRSWIRPPPIMFRRFWTE